MYVRAAERGRPACGARPSGPERAAPVLDDRHDRHDRHGRRRRASRPPLPPPHEPRPDATLPSHHTLPAWTPPPSWGHGAAATTRATGAAGLVRGAAAPPTPPRRGGAPSRRARTANGAWRRRTGLLQYGGGLYLSSSTATVSDTTFASNSASVRSRRRARPAGVRRASVRTRTRGACPGRPTRPTRAPPRLAGTPPRRRCRTACAFQTPRPPSHTRRI